MKSQTAKSAGEVIQVSILKIVPNGFGLGFSEGLTVFVALTAVGDEVLAKITERKGKVAFAEVVEVLSSNENRVTPRCRHFGVCGGCDFQQMSYSEQLRAKIAIIEDCFKRIGKIDSHPEIKLIPSPNEFGYRTRAQWHADSRRHKLGYFRRSSHDVIHVEECPILDPLLQNELSRRQKETKFNELWDGKTTLDAATDGTNISISCPELIEPENELEVATSFGKFRYNAGSFFQANSSLLENLLEVATNDASGTSAADLFCGVGIFTIALAKRFGKVFGVEHNEKSVEFARENSQRNNITNAEFFSSNVDEWINSRTDPLDFVLLDPPRAGASRSTLEAILRSKPRAIAYVSCDPATLARDLRLLLDGGFSIGSVSALDLFPQTHHIETVVRLNSQNG